MFDTVHLTTIFGNITNDLFIRFLFSKNASLWWNSIFFLIPTADGMLNDSDRLLANKIKSISAEKMVVNCARLHQKLSDIIIQFNYCYSTMVKHHFQFSKWEIFKQDQNSFQFMLGNTGNFINILRSLYALYAILFSQRTSYYKLGPSVYEFCSLMFYTSIIFTNHFLASWINSEVYANMYKFWKSLNMRFLGFCLQNHRTAFFVNKAIVKSKDPFLRMAVSAATSFTQTHSLT